MDPRSGPPRDGEGTAVIPTSLLVFEVAGHLLGVPADDVREVVRAVAVSGIPGAPEVVQGVMDLRGELVPVLDLRRRFGLEPRELEPGEHFVVVRAPGRDLALRVDQARELARLRPEDVASASPELRLPAAAAGVARLASGLVVIHDVRRFLSDTEARGLERALAAEEAAR